MRGGDDEPQRRVRRSCRRQSSRQRIRTRRSKKTPPTKVASSGGGGGGGGGGTPVVIPRYAAAFPVARICFHLGGTGERRDQILVQATDGVPVDVVLERTDGDVALLRCRVRR
jgi:hypothetical protein